MEASKYLDELNQTRAGLKNEPKLLEKAMEQLKSLDLQIEDQRRIINEKDESIATILTKIQEYEGRISFKDLREKLANKSIESLNKKIECTKAQIEEKKLEIATLVNENMFKMIECAKAWNCSELGVNYRKMQRMSTLEEMRKRKCNLKLELEEYMKRKEVLDRSTKETFELEEKLDYEKNLMREKEFAVKKQIDDVNKTLNDLVNERDNEVPNLDNQDKITFERLQSRISNLKNSIGYWGCRVENAQKSLNLQRKNHMDFDFELEMELNEQNGSGGSSMVQQTSAKRLYVPSGPKPSESPRVKRAFVSSSSQYQSYQEMLRQKEQKSQEARRESMSRNSFMKLTQSSDGFIKAEPIPSRSSTSNQQGTPKDLDSHRFVPEIQQNRFKQFQFKKK